MSTRFPFIFLAVTLLCGGAASAAPRQLAGTIVDQTGRAVPRAYVRVLDESGVPLAGVFADEGGRFDVAACDAGGCHLEASLTGFQPATVPCAASAAGQPLRVVLAVAPIQERMIVMATRTVAPPSQVDASVPVNRADDLERRQTPLLADLLTETPGALIVRSGAPGALTSLFVRGGESDYNKTTAD